MRVRSALDLLCRLGVENPQILREHAGPRYVIYSSNYLPITVPISQLLNEDPYADYILQEIRLMDTFNGRTGVIYG